MSEIQRYRVNYRLLVSLVVGGCVTAVAAYFLWLFQVDRNANRLLARAEAAQAESDDQEAYDALSQYVKLRPDEEEVRVRYGMAAAKLLEHDDLDMVTQSDAYHGLADSVVRTSDQPLRRKLVDFYMAHGVAERALQPIEELLAAGQNDPELKVMKARCLFANQRSAEAAKYCFKLIGYDQKTGKFDDKAAEVVDKPEIYALLAQYLFEDRKADLAKQVIDRMIATNPKSRDAYVCQYQFLKRIDEGDPRAPLETAYKLDPKDATVLLFKGLEELQDYQETMEAATADKLAEVRKEAEKHLDVAAKFFAEGLQEHPDRIAFYEYAGRVELARDRIPEALAIVDRGLKKFDLKSKLMGSGVPQAIELANFKLDLYFSKDDLDSVRREIKALRDLHNTKVDPLVDYAEARLQIEAGNWMEAARSLGDVKGRLINYPAMQAMAGAAEGVCYSQLGQYDLALQAYDWALEKNPGLPQAVAGKEEMQRMTSQNARQADPLQFDKMVKDMLALPKEQQKWDELTAKIDEYVDSQAQTRSVNESWLSARKQLLRAQLFATRALAIDDEAEKTQLFNQARQAITEAFRINPKDISVQSAAPRLLALEPKSGPTKALELLDQIVKKNGDSPGFRLLRIDLLSMKRSEDFTTAIYAATEGMDKWTPDQQAQVWAAAGMRFEQFGQLQDARSCVSKAAELAPNILQHCISLFDLSLKQGDDDGMRAAQEKLLKIIKSESDPNYVVTEVKRRMFGYANGSIAKEQMQEARTMVEAAIKLRPSWADLHQTSGQLWLAFERSPEKALVSFDKALASGPANLNALNMQIRLLADLGRFTEARQKMNLVPRTAWPALLDAYGPTILSKVGQTDEAYNEAKLVADLRAEDSGTQMWFADIASQANKLDAAEAAIKQAVKSNPTDPDLWASLLAFYVRQKKSDDVERVLRDAQLALDDEFLPLLMAKRHELFGRWSQAEKILLSYYSDLLETPYVCRRMGEFYLLWSNRDPVYRTKANVYINNLLRAANDGKLQASDPFVVWARRQGAKILSLDQDYHDSLKAEQLLQASIAGKAATAEDQAQLVEILNLRGDPASHERAVAILRQLQKQEGDLTPQRELQLGAALYDLGEWKQCEKQMRDAISRHPKDISLRVAYIKWLLARKEFAQAESWINRIKDVPGAIQAVPELMLRLTAARGDHDKARAMLQAMTPDLRVASEAKLNNLRIISLLASEAGDHEYALKLMREYARRTKQNSNELTRMIALHSDLDDALTTVKTAFPSNTDEVLRIAAEMLRARRAEAPERLDEEVNRLVRAARHDDPESAQRMVLEAEVGEIQERYDESIEAYRALLARDDVPLLIRSTAANNLAFLLSLKKVDLDEAMKLVTDAIANVGPISDILDTRGLVYHAKGDFAKAVEDLTLCVKVGPTPSKYFHLAAALLAAGDKKKAVDAWQQAEIMDIGPTKVSKLEWDQLKDVTQQIEAIRTSTASR